MAHREESGPSGGAVPGPVSLDAVTTALRAVDRAVSAAARGEGTASPAVPDSPEEALAALLLLREVRERLAGWETGLIETARSTGASWTDLAAPLGVSSRQAAERRYLRGRPGAEGATGEQRVQATRDRRAADRTVTAWARQNAAALRGLAGRITALTDLPARSGPPITQLGEALGDNDPAGLIEPLAEARRHLTSAHPELAAQVDALTGHADKLREDSDHQRRTPEAGARVGRGGVGGGSRSD